LPWKIRIKVERPQRFVFLLGGSDGRDLFGATVEE